MATQDETLELIQQLIAYGFHPPKGVTIAFIARSWVKMFANIDYHRLERALNDEVLADPYWPKVPNLLKRMGLIGGAPDPSEGAEVLQLLLRIMRSSAYRRSNELDYDPIADLYPFRGPRVEGLRRALMAAGGWRGLAQLPADLGDDMRACADIRKAYQCALAESYNRHRRDGLQIPNVSFGQMLMQQQQASDHRRALVHRARMEAIGCSSTRALTDDAPTREKAARRAEAARLVGDSGAGLRLLRDLGGE